MTIEEMRKRKQELGYSYQDISVLAKLPLSTVQKVLGGVTVHPRRETVRKLEALLARGTAINAAEADAAFLSEPNGDGCVAEAESSYDGTGALSSMTAQVKATAQAKVKAQVQGNYTLADYYALPDEQRAELIDGVFYEMSSPSAPHQLISGAIYAQLMAFRKSRRISCMPLISPMDVQLDRDERTMVEPDVMIVCDRSKIRKNCVFGAPDFVVEVFSPSTRKKDMSIKLVKYLNAGVREYWQIDPELRKVIVYDLEGLKIPEIYSFAEPVPVEIWGGKCRIDFSEVSEMIGDFFTE